MSSIRELVPVRNVQPLLQKLVDAHARHAADDLAAAIDTAHPDPRQHRRDHQ